MESVHSGCVASGDPNGWLKQYACLPGEKTKQIYADITENDDIDMAKENCKARCQTMKATTLDAPCNFAALKVEGENKSACYLYSACDIDRGNATDYIVTLGSNYTFTPRRHK